MGFMQTLLDSALYADDPHTAVPYALLICHVLQLLTLIPLVLWVAELRCAACGYQCKLPRTRRIWLCPFALVAAATRGGRQGVERLLADAAAEQADEESGFLNGVASASVLATLNTQLLILGLALLAAAGTLLLLLLPIQHGGAVAAAIYVARGAVDAAALCYCRPTLREQQAPQLGLTRVPSALSPIVETESAPAQLGRIGRWLYFARFPALASRFCGGSKRSNGRNNGRNADIGNSSAVVFRRSPPLSLLLFAACGVRLARYAACDEPPTDPNTSPSNYASV